MSQSKPAAAAHKNCLASFSRPFRVIDACEKTITQKTYLGLEKKKKEKKSITESERKLKGKRTKRVRRRRRRLRMNGWALFNLGGRKSGPVPTQTKGNGGGRSYKFRRG